MDTHVDEKAQAFVAYLTGLAEREERGALAALRRGLGRAPGTTPETFRHVVPWLSREAVRADEDRYFLVASLFGLHPANTLQGDMGATFRQIHRAGGHEEGDSLEKRFVALLNAHSDDLPNHLRHAVAMARSNDVPVNWYQLLRDLRRWNHPDRFVQRNWATSFWRRSAGAPEDTDSDQPA
jgi:CRISPR system Cascade subunit CasB